MPDKELQTVFYTAVGQAISFWVDLESRIVEVAASLIGTTRDKAGVVMHANDFARWEHIIGDLFDLQPDLKKQRKKWNKLAEKLRPMNDIRVRLAHHTSANTNDKIPALTPSRYDKRSKSRKHAPLKAHEIAEFMHNIIDAHKKADRLLSGLPPPPSNPISPQVLAAALLRKSDEQRAG
jgi:hypothetical protein